MSPTQRLAGECNLLVTQWRTMAGLFALLVGRAPTDHSSAADKRGVCRISLGLIDRLGDRLRIMAINILNDLPAIGAKTRWRVIGKPTLNIAVDRNAVVIPKSRQFAQAQGARKRAGLMGNPLHQAPITQKNISTVINNGMAISVELCRKHFLCQSHAHAIGNALAQWPGSGFHSRRIAILGMAWCARMQLAKILQLFGRQIVPGQMQ